MTDFEYYPTPRAFTRWLFREVSIGGRVAEVCVEDGAIVEAVVDLPHQPARTLVTNDLDERWPADAHEDARSQLLYRVDFRATEQPIDWVVTNPPFTPAIEIITRALEYATVGVAMHLRASIHEVLKTGVRRTWMAKHPPTGILWLPRFAYQRNAKGKWNQDSVCACWVVWLKDATVPQFIRYAPVSVLDELKADTPAYRRRMDQLMAARAA